MRPALAASVASIATLLIAAQASAFCRVRSCDTAAPMQNCQIDDRGCVVSGHTLFWPSICLRIGVNEAGSVRHGIGFEQLRDTTQAAFQTWTNADCAPGGPSLRVEVVGPVPCDRSEHNQNAGNVNLVVFRDDAWPYAGAIDVLGRTSVRFNADTGQLWDADIEINGTAGAISLDGTGDIDLQSVLTHEAGRALGLDHSDMLGATMVARYTASDTSLRTLEFDDVQGICAIFPPGAESSGSCEPKGGFSDQCGGFIDAGPEPGPPPVPPSDDGGCGVARTAAPDRSAPIAGLHALVLCAVRRRSKTRRVEAG